MTVFDFLAILIVMRIFPEICAGFQIDPQPHPQIISTLVKDSISVSHQRVGYHC